MVDSLETLLLLAQSVPDVPDGASFGYWVITGLMVPVIGFLALWVKQLIKDKEVALEKANTERVTDMREQIGQYHDALKVVEASFEMAKSQSVKGEVFWERMNEFISSSRAFQDRVLELLKAKQ